MERFGFFSGLAFFLVFVVAACTGKVLPPVMTIPAILLLPFAGVVLAVIGLRRDKEKFAAGMGMILNGLLVLLMLGGVLILWYAMSKQRW